MTQPDVKGLALLGILLSLYLLILLGWPRLRHWLCHHYQWQVGPYETWRRKADNVLMVGNRCPVCGELYCIRPSKTSYRHMMQGRKFY